MSNLSKNSLLALTLVCVIALVAFFIHLIIINTGAEPDEPSSAHTQNGADGGLVNGGPQDGADPSGGLPAGPLTTKRELIITGDTSLVIYADDEQFDFVAVDEFDWMFLYTGTGMATLEVTLMFFTDQGLETDATWFLFSHTEGLPVEFDGEGQILDSALRGYRATAHSEYMIYEAWFHELHGGEFGQALAFVLNYSTDTQRDALYAVLNTIRFT